MDMLYFPILDTNWPEWVPWLGGDRLQFFRPIFNVADSSITVGMALILINQKRFFKEEAKSGDQIEAEQNPE
ncbi:MAG: signal peptidase II [Cryomorphaceae bacterium]